MLSGPLTPHGQARGAGENKKWRQLTQTTKKNAFSLLIYDDFFDALSKATWFNTLDIGSGY